MAHAARDLSGLHSCLHAAQMNDGDACQDPSESNVALERAQQSYRLHLAGWKQANPGISGCTSQQREGKRMRSGQSVDEVPHAHSRSPQSLSP